MQTTTLNKFHGCAARRARRARRRRFVLGVMVVLAVVVIGLGQRWVLTEAPPSDLGFAAANAAAEVLASHIN
jgi:hypothetical protein